MSFSYLDSIFTECQMRRKHFLIQREWYRDQPYLFNSHIGHAENGINIRNVTGHFRNQELFTMVFRF